MFPTAAIAGPRQGLNFLSTAIIIQAADVCCYVSEKISFPATYRIGNSAAGVPCRRRPMRMLAMLAKLRRLVGAKLTQQGTARTAVAIMIATALAVGCGVHKTADGGAGEDAAGSGGSSGSGTGGSRAGTGGSRAGTGGQTFDVGSFDINLDGLSLDGFSLDGFSLDGFGADISISTCPTGVKTGDACTSGETFCTGAAGRGCYCNGGKWFCLGG
jgi:hypothetical protein